MKLFQIILVLSSLLILTNCVGVHPQKVDISKIKKLTGWAPSTDLWTGLKHTVEANLK